MSEKQSRPKDYNRLITTIIEDAAKARFEVKVLETLVYGKEGFPFLMLKSENRGAKYNCVITAGAHGDEPQGVECLVQALGDLDTTLWNYWIFPVTNPFGWKYGVRVNGNQAGINWKVGERETKELSLIFRNLPHKLALFIDAHGDADETKAYIYERKLPTHNSLASLVLKDVSSYFEAKRTKTVYREPNKDGVVASGREGTLEEFMFERKGAEFSLTVEIPGRITGTGVNQIAGGGRMIVAALNNFERAKGIGIKPKEEAKPQIAEQPVEQPKEEVG